MTINAVRTAASINLWLQENFKEAGNLGNVVETMPMGARVEFNTDNSHFRPGGSISGPTQMALVDQAFYCALLAQSERYVMAVTSNLNINFLHRPDDSGLVATARILKLGKRLAVGEVSITQSGDSSQPVAHATVTYTLPATSLDSA